MKTIGILSDTHGYLDPAIFGVFQNCDEIWHAGDFGSGVADSLSAFKPLKGVYGNIDGEGIRKTFHRVFKLSM
jgi:predicted phosphodiesterase